MRGIRVVTVSLAVLLAACTSGVSMADPATTMTPTTSAPAETTTTTTTRADSVAEVVEALTTWRDEEESHRRYEETMAACMRQSGFEYTPRPYVEQLPAAMGSVLSPVEERRPFLEEFGYGLTTRYWDVEWERLDNMGVDNDPNQARIAAMSEAEREAYDEAMLGERTGEYVAGSEGVGWHERETDGSCSAQALASRPSVGVDRDALPEATQRALEEVHERVAADPAVAEVTEAWYRCMAEAGYPLDDIARMYGDRYTYLTGEELAYRLADRLNARALRWNDVEIRMGDGSTYVEQVPEFAPDALADAQAEELRIAAADLACDEETGRAETLIATRERIHEEVVADNLADFLEVLGD